VLSHQARPLSKASPLISLLRLLFPFAAAFSVSRSSESYRLPSNLRPSLLPAAFCCLRFDPLLKRPTKGEAIQPWPTHAVKPCTFSHIEAQATGYDLSQQHQRLGEGHKVACHPKVWLSLPSPKLLRLRSPSLTAWETPDCSGSLLRPSDHSRQPHGRNTQRNLRLSGQTVFPAASVRRVRQGSRRPVKSIPKLLWRCFSTVRGNQSAQDTTPRVWDCQT
jgi:hypothetical protein